MDKTLDDKKIIYIAKLRIEKAKRVYTIETDQNYYMFTNKKLAKLANRVLQKEILTF